jgi:hypothetical protein
MKKLILLSLLIISFCFVNAQIEQIDSVSNSKTKEFIDPYYAPQPNLWQPPITPGDYLKLSGVLRLTGLGFGITTTTLFFTGAFNEMGLSFNEQRSIAIISGSVSLILYIAGELTLIKAGKLMNEERVSLSPASEGIGLAINF